MASIFDFIGYFLSNSDIFKILFNNYLIKFFMYNIILFKHTFNIGDKPTDIALSLIIPIGFTL